MMSFSLASSHQRPAAVDRVDGGIGLNKPIHPDVIRAAYRGVEAADPAAGHDDASETTPGLHSASVCTRM